jgi:hypothetical protein
VGAVGVPDRHSGEENVGQNARVSDGHKTQLRDEGRRVAKGVHKTSFVLLSERRQIHVVDGLTVFGRFGANLHYAITLGHLTSPGRLP